MLPCCLYPCVPAAVTPGASLQRSMSPGGTDPRAQLAERMASPELTDGLRDMHQQMVIKQITALERRVKELEGGNERLKEQVRPRGLGETLSVS